MYFHRDRLGSLRVVSNEDGAVFDSMEFDEFGARVVTTATRKFHTYTSGFSFQEHVDNLALVHMNGRMYDPRIGRFLSPDPYLDFRHSPQGLNRYVYALNNPLRYTDPSGYGFIDDFFSDVVGGVMGGIVEFISPVFEEFGRFMNKHGRTVMPIVAGLLVSTVNPVAGAAVMGFTSAAVHGASFEESLRAAAVSAAVAYVMGGVTKHTKDWSYQSRFAAQGAAGGALAKARGGDFETGFFSAGITSLTPPLANHGDIDFGDLAVRATIGGTVATVRRGKFENGATVAAFSYMFARLAAPKPAAMNGGKIYITGRRVGKAFAVHLGISRHGSSDAIGAEPDGFGAEGASWLKAEFPRSEDDTSNPYGNVVLGEVVPPEGMTTTEYFDLLESHVNYSQVDYDYFPGISDGYNSNSFVRGVIEATGGSSSIDLSNFVGGGKPVPKSAFGVSQ
jgi:RHS repeat-associated protein